MGRKSPILTPSHLHFTPTLGFAPFEFPRVIWHHKTRVPLFAWSYVYPFW